MPFPTTSTIDDFNRADTGPPPSGSWTTDPWSYGAAGHKVVSNQAVGNGATDNHSAYSGTYGPNAEAFVTVADLGSESYTEIASAGVRSTGAGNAYEAALNKNLGDGTFNVTINKWVSLTLTVLATYSVTAANGCAIGVTAIGSTIEAWFKPAGGSWTSLGSVTDTTHTAAGRIELYSRGVSVKLDDWGGGTVPTARLPASILIAPTIIRPVAPPAPQVFGRPRRTNRRASSRILVAPTIIRPVVPPAPQVFGMPRAATTTPLTITPAPAECSSATVAPSVVLSNVTIAPVPAEATSATVVPAVELGSLTLSPAPATVAVEAVAPSVVLSDITLSPTPASVTTATVAPTLGLPSGAYRLFFNDNGPAALSDAYAISLSMEFTVSADCEVTHLHYWRGASDVPSGQAGRIYQVGNSTALASVNFSSDTGVGWQTAALSTPLALSAGTSYFVTVYFPTGRFASTANYWDTGAGASGKTYGILSAPNNASATSGIGQSPFSFGIDAYPYSAAVSATNYWVDVTVQVNDITVTPAAATCSAVTVVPAVVLSNVTIAPAAASASSAANAPIATMGSVIVAPEPASASAVSIAPTVTLSGVTVSPDPSEARAVSIAPVVTLGTIALTPSAASAQAETTAPAVVLSSVAVSPQPASASFVTISPNVTQTGISVTPQPVTASAVTVAPDVTLSTVAVTAISASMSAVTIDPTVIIFNGGVTVTPSPATCSVVTVSPDVTIFTPSHPTPPMSGIGTRGGARVGGRGGSNTGARATTMSVGTRRRT